LRLTLAYEETRAVMQIGAKPNLHVHAHAAHAAGHTAAH